ncbi:MAG TPA: single-stranded DNA-binding protein [Tepidisphaeraceae bacterium]|jgi:single-strand DNA-binding protein
MASYNKVLLMGNLTRDPQLKYLPSQTAVVDFGVACNRRYKTQSGEQKEEVTFVDCSAFGRTAEVINQYFTKGKPIFIEGRLRYEQWEDKQGGGKRSRLSVHVDNFQFIGGRDGGGGGGGEMGGDEAPPQSHPQRGPQRSAQSGPPPEQSFPDEPQFKEDDIPF